MMDIEKIKTDILNGKEITKKQALELYDQPLEILCKAADEIRKHFCSNIFDMCTIINGKSGRCPENCKFCAQSAHFDTKAAEYPLLPDDDIVAAAKHSESQGILRFSIVTSGRRLSDGEVEQMCATIRRIKSQSKISVCVSFGLLDKAQYIKLKNAGVDRVHNNLETSKRYFPNICATHSFDDKINAIKAAKTAGLSVCSGGIMGLGETPEDRIDMALTLRELGIKSIPLNILNPIAGTPLSQNKPLCERDIRRIAAVYRFILPDAEIRLAGGRGLLKDKGKSCFESGANAAITGDMLTTAGISAKTDMELLGSLGYKVGYCHE